MGSTDGETSATRSDLSGTARDVVQARDITGGIHFHGSSDERAPVPAQLPADVRGFVNRTADLAHLDARLIGDIGNPNAASVCVLAGTAGVGKTSTAVRWAHRNRERFPDGQLYVNLRGYDPGEPVAAKSALEWFLAALGVAATAIPSDTESRSALFRSLLASRRMLIVLDNAATVGQVRPLLPGAGSCLALVTSRSRLSGLVARDNAHRITLEVFGEAEAVELVQATTAPYRVGDAGAEIGELARLCARLPLALRIAAERAAARPHMPLSELIEDLRGESSLWDALSTEDDEEGDADAVRSVFAWSYRALTVEAARMFRLLGLFPGPEFSTGAAAALAGVRVPEARKQLDALAGAHLLGQLSRDRFQFHDLLRAYAADQNRGEEYREEGRAGLDRLLGWYLLMADACVSAVSFAGDNFESVPLDDVDVDTDQPTFADSEAALLWYDAERTNVTSIVGLAVGAGRAHLAWRIPAVLRVVHCTTNNFDDWFAAAEAGLRAARRCESLLGQGLLLESLTMACRQSHRLIEAMDYGLAALKLCRSEGRRQGEAMALNLLSLVCLEGHRLDEAAEYAGQAESICLEEAYDGLMSSVLGNLSWSLIELKRFQEALEVATRGLHVARRMSSKVEEAAVLLRMLQAKLGLGRYDEADEDARNLFAQVEESGDLTMEAVALVSYGDLLCAKGDVGEALRSYQRSASIQDRLGDRNRQAHALMGVGRSYSLQDRFEDAAAFYRQAVGLYSGIGNRWHQALALDGLATALHSDDAPDEDASSVLWSEALTLIGAFSDPAAAELRTSIEQSLATSHVIEDPLSD